MINTQTLKTHYDLRTIVEQDLGPAPIHSARANLYKCPFHKEKKGHSLAVWADGYKCFGTCNLAGDLFDWLMSYRQHSFSEAIAALKAPVSTSILSPKPLTAGVLEPPPNAWQVSAQKVVEIAEDILWATEGESALTYLQERGLSNHTIRNARLGYVPGDFRQWLNIDGLKVPCGITIPWFASDALWAVKVRRAYGEPKYVQIAGGSSHGLYNADKLSENSIALFCEGEFDALLAQQEAGKLVSTVTLGSVANRLSFRWLSQLTSLRGIYVAYDSDSAGRRGAETLLHVSPRFHDLSLPYAKDISDYYLNGSDVYAWIANSIATRQGDSA